MNLLLIGAVLLFYLLFVQTTIAQRMTNAAYDYIISSKADFEPDEPVIVIAIDDFSIQALNKKWPWPRSYHALLVDYLTEAGAKAIAYNILFSESSNEDAILRKSLGRNGRVVLPVAAHYSEAGRNVFSHYATLGHVATENDGDGVLRGITLFEEINTLPVPNFALALLQVTHPDLYAEYELRYGAESPHYGEKSNFVFGNRRAMEFYSFSDVLLQKVPKHVFEDRIIFVGVNATGVGERFIVAHRDRAAYTGMGVQVSLYEALLEDALVHQPSQWIRIFINISVLIFAVLIVRNRRYEPSVNSVIGIVYGASLFFATYLIYAFSWYWISLINAGAIILLFTFIYAVSTTHYRLREANRNLEQHVMNRTHELRLTNSSLAQEVREREKITQSLRHSEQSLRTLFDNIEIGILTTNEEGAIVTANRTILEFFGHNLSEMLNKNAEELFDAHLLYEGEPFCAKTVFDQVMVTDEQAVEIEAEIRRPRGAENLPVALNISQLQQGRTQKYVCLVRDISEQKHVEKMTQEFIATVSHELRTPITSVKGSLELIHAGVAGELTPKMKHLLSLARRNSDRILMLVNDILDIQRIQLGTLQFHQEALDLGQVVRQSVEMNQSYSDIYRTGITLELPDSPNALIVMGDEDRLIQVMSNLISNAIKFSPPGGKNIEVKVEQEEGYIVVSVKDYGCGIAEDFRPKIFGKFAQAGEARHRSKGTGLGLSITKALLERMRGEIDYHSVEGEGSTFFFKLPVLTPLEMRKFLDKRGNRETE